MIYVASSWRNPYYQDVILSLRRAGYVVYDFRHPVEGNAGFHWSQIDPAWKEWKPLEFRRALQHPLAVTGFALNFTALSQTHLLVLVLPCGRSSHLEAGFVAGKGRPVIVHQRDPEEPELMYKLTATLTTTDDELLASVKQHLWEKAG